MVNAEIDCGKNTAVFEVCSGSGGRIKKSFVADAAPDDRVNLVRDFVGDRVLCFCRRFGFSHHE